MSRLIILSSQEHQQFDSPPQFTSDQRLLYFSLTNDVLEQLHSLRTPTNRVGFILQLGYFKSHAKFYRPHQFRDDDTQYVASALGISPNDINLTRYSDRIIHVHKRRVLTFLGWKAFTLAEKKELSRHIQTNVAEYLSPKQIFLNAVQYCWKHHIEVPSYNQYLLLITRAFQQVEYQLNEKINRTLSKHKKTQLTALVHNDNVNSTASKKSTLTTLRALNQSVRPADIQTSLHAFKTIKTYYTQYHATLLQLALSQSAIRYFASWVHKATISQLTSLDRTSTLPLYLLAYIQHNYYLRHDQLVDVLLKSVKTMIHAAHRYANEQEQLTRKNRNQAIKCLTKTHRSAQLVIDNITTIIQSATLSDADKLATITTTIQDYHQQQTDDDKEKITAFEKQLDTIANRDAFFDALTTLSNKLQRRVADLLTQLTFDPESSDTDLIAAITYYVNHTNDMTANAPTAFLNASEKVACLSENNGLSVSLYKALLFIHVANAIKSGKLNLMDSYRYKAIQDYLISPQRWKQHKKQLISEAGFVKKVDINHLINDIKQTLHQQYESMNKHLINGDNPHLQVDNATIKVQTPAVDNDDMTYISSLLTQAGFIPILQILSDIDRITHFSHEFTHMSIKNAQKTEPSSDRIYAGMLSQGCNIGLRQMAQRFSGITEANLHYTVNWFFTLKNIESANNKISSITDQLALAHHFQHKNDELHTSSDGRKVPVSVDSLQANHSFKYFGKGKGVSMYTFIDERQLLFYSTVISASEREAAYVIDGLLHNDVVKSDIHSTDTHGFTEVIFSAMYFIGTAFAPRFKDIDKQTRYAFKAKSTYENQGYLILPSRTINQKLIETHWDDILRFMTTIKLHHAPASQLLKRLSSYAKENPLYKALKEFGRILKSQFILTYFDEVVLRQRIEKQLNKIELSNKLSKAIFFGNNQTFKLATAEEQLISTACMRLIQNAIVLWNYLYLSQLLVNQSDEKQRKIMSDAIQHGSMMTWQHINFYGEYDFKKQTSPHMAFDLEKILNLKIE